MDIDLKKMQAKLLDLMKVVHDVCVSNNITYYMLGGTMLGAIRHQGFIPWDDDMDIGIPREDYERLLSLPESTWPSNIHIKTPHNSRDLIFPYAKIMNTDTTIVEDKLGGIVEGIYIDIFPLDGAGNNAFIKKAHFYNFFFKQLLLYYNQYDKAKETMPRQLLQFVSRRFDKHQIYKSVEKCMKKYSFNHCKYVGNFSGAWAFKEIMPYSFMGKPNLYKFEDFKLFGCERPDEYLTSLYGDYMTPPPIEKQKSHHRFSYVNLDLPYSEYLNKMLYKGGKR